MVRSVGAPSARPPWNLYKGKRKAAWRSGSFEPGHQGMVCVCNVGHRRGRRMLDFSSTPSASDPRRNPSSEPTVRPFGPVMPLSPRGPLGLADRVFTPSVL